MITDSGHQRTVVSEPIVPADQPALPGMVRRWRALASDIVSGESMVMTTKGGTMKIGDFARLGQVSVRMLRHYEAVGLLRPDAVDPFTGHRRYTVAQLSRLNAIMALSAVGIPLREMAEVLDGIDRVGLADLLRLRRRQLESDRDEIETKLRDVDFRLALIERHTMTTIDCVRKDLPAERVLGRSVLLGEPPFDTSKIGPLFGTVAEQISALGGCPDIGVGLYTDTAAGTEVTCGYRHLGAVPEPLPDGLTLTDLPATQAATLIHEGPMEHIGGSWQLLAEWCVRQGHTLTGPCREIYLEAGDGTDDSDQSDWVVELQQPILMR